MTKNPLSLGEEIAIGNIPPIEVPLPNIGRCDEIRLRKDCSASFSQSFLPADIVLQFLRFSNLPRSGRRRRADAPKSKTIASASSQTWSIERMVSGLYYQILGIFRPACFWVQCDINYFDLAKRVRAARRSLHLVPTSVSGLIIAP
jgi:hypothetical protein